MYKNKSYVTLYNLPIQLNSTSNINWGKINKENYFNSIQDQITYDDFTDLYRDRGFALPDNLENLRKYNYMKLHYENEVGVNKDFYCFIESYEYISQEVSVPIYSIDYHTSFGYFGDMQINVERETPDINRTEYLFDEDFYPPRYNITSIDYDTSRYYVIKLNRSINGYKPTGKINLVYNSQNVTTFNLDSIYILCNSTGLFNRLQTEYTEYVTDVYSVTAYQLGGYKSSVDGSNFVYIYNQNINVGTSITVNKPSGYNNFLARYPYFYVNIGDNMYDPIDFTNQTPTFAVFPTFVRNMGIVYIPINYKGESINKSYTTSVDNISSIGATIYNSNSLSTQETIEQSNNSISVANQNYSAEQRLASLDKKNNIDMANINNEQDLYNWAKQKKSIADQQDIMGFGLGGGALIGGVFKALGKSVRDMGKKFNIHWNIPVVGDIEIPLGDWVFSPIGDIVENIGDTLKSAFESVEQAVGERLLSEDMTGFNRESMLDEAKQAQIDYANSSYNNTVSSLQNARDAAIAQASTDKKYAGLQGNIILSSDYIGNYLTFTFPLVYSIDTEYIDDVKNYYNYFGAYINENRTGKIVNNNGNYYYFKGMIIKSNDISNEDIVQLNIYYNNGVRLYNSTDPSIFGKL